MAAKKSGKKPAEAKPAKRKITAVRKPMTKTELVSEIAVNTGLSKKQVSSVFDEFTILIERHIKKRSPGKLVFPGLFKIEVRKKSATKAREGINPQTKEPMTIPAKPAHRVVRIRPLKKLKDMIG
ncbi:MAG: HU family DNA-binding protein [Deltaproteobacteria bacterium]|nr:HU family DNA-binding protein [Deltaproteobacteria bacterium]MBW2047438.1 HU family DNA-binding protein [Deltaproteobacteria bacterium]MBW2112055.1 HU family DNA-binding protein [Deltaproteobacteria bacterium]MBW2353428.1 HU family DNA-binding protein [Deltaproteobacteria bacterium]HDZ91780.1 DNA-binding protein [Deltaproteobacteria bacterium]